MRALLGLLTLLLLGVAALWFLLPSRDAWAAGPGGLTPAAPRSTDLGGTVEGDETAATAARSEVAPVPLEGDSATTTSDDLPRLIGRVVDGQGAGVAGAAVFASTGWAWMQPPLDMEDDGIGQGWVQRAVTETDAQGRFALDEPLRPGELRLALRADGRAPRYDSGLRLGESRPQDLGDLVLEPGVSLGGRVVDRGGRGLPGVEILQVIERGVGGHEVTVPGRGVPLGASGAEGRFRVSGLAPGPWALMLDSPEHQVREERGRVDQPGEVEDLLFVLERGDDVTGRVEGLDAQRRAGARVDARVADSERGREDVALHPRARRAQLGADGRFRVAGLIPGVAHRLTLWERGEDGRYERSGDVQALEVWPGARDVVLEVEPRGSLSLTVVDAASGAPVEDFVLFAGMGAQGRARTQVLNDDDGKALRHHPGGRALFEGLRVPEGGGTATLQVSAPGYRDLERSDVRLVPGQVRDLGQLPIERGPCLRVTVSGAADGLPIEGARVLVTTEEQRQTLDWMLAAPGSDPWSNRGMRAAVTDEQGVAQVSLVPAERCVVGATAEGFVPAEPLPVPAATAGETTLAFVLGAGGRVLATVVDSAAAPVQGIQVEYRKPTPQGSEQFGNQLVMLGYAGGSWGAAGSVTTDARGRAEIGPLEPGPWTIDLPNVGGAVRTEPQTVEVVEGGRHEVTLQIPARADLEGVVTQARLPLAGADLSLSPLQSAGGPSFPRGFLPMGLGGQLSALSGHGGRYRIEDVPCGEYRLQVTHPDRYLPETIELTVSPGGTVLDVELPLTVLEGTVRYRDGRPVPGLRVEVSAADGRRAGWRPGGMRLVEDDRGQLQPDWGGVGRRIETDAQGRYRVAGLASGVELRVSTAGPYATRGLLTGIHLAPDEVRSGVDLEVDVAGRLRLQLAPGAPQGAWRVTLKRQVEQGKPEVSGTQLWGDRPRTLDSLAAGEWNLEVWPAQAGTEPVLRRTVEVIAEQLRDVTLEVR